MKKGDIEAKFYKQKNEEFKELFEETLKYRLNNTGFTEKQRKQILQLIRKRR